MKKPAITSLLIMSLVLVLVTSVSAGVPAAPLAPDVVTSNPDLLPGCGIDVILVLDASASIDSGEQQDVEDAANAFLSALVGTGSKVAIVEFASSTTTGVPYTALPGPGVPAVFTNYLAGYPHTATVGQYTNWGYAWWQVNQLASADLVVFVTDGNPTAHGGYNGITYEQDSSPNATQLENFLAAAETQANITKTGGSHNFAVGVGSDLNITNLYRVLDDGGTAGNLQLTTRPQISPRRISWLLATSAPWMTPWRRSSTTLWRLHHCAQVAGCRRKPGYDR